MSFFVPTRFVWRFGGRQVRCCGCAGGNYVLALPAGGQGGDAGQGNLLAPRRHTAAAHAMLHPACVCIPGAPPQVHLCGSFTRWVETIPMAPVEGTPGVFAVVVHLPPG